MADYRARMAERIQQEMNAQSLTPESLGARADVSDKTIKRVIEQSVDPRPSTIRRIARGLNLDVRELRPPVEMEEEQMERIEQKLDAIIDYFGITVPAEEPAEDVELSAAEAGRLVARSRSLQREAHEQERTRQR